MISKTHARDFPALSAARTLPSREYRSPSGIEWSPVAMEIEIYGRTYGARLAALMEFKDVGIHPQKRAAAGSRYVYEPPRTPCRPHVYRARVFTAESSRNDFFIARLRARYGGRVDVLAARSKVHEV